MNDDHPLLASDHIVLDLETMSTSPRAAIVALGCARIVRGNISGTLYERVNLASAIAQGGEVDASTIQWWLKQSPEAQSEVNGERSALHVVDALNRLVEFVGSCKNPILVWGNGATFDNVIISSALQRAGIKRPWHYAADRDLRTIVDLYPEAKEQAVFCGIRHHAMDDALYEANILCNAISLHTQGARHVQA